MTNQNQNQGQITIDQLDSMHSADTGMVVKILGRKDETISNLARANTELNKALQATKADVEGVKKSLETISKLVDEKDIKIQELEKTISELKAIIKKPESNKKD